MYWEAAFSCALRRMARTGRKYYVRAYRKTNGEWRYGVYREPWPENGRNWVRDYDG